jgi:hypothetical protein
VIKDECQKVPGIDPSPINGVVGSDRCQRPSTRSVSISAHAEVADVSLPCSRWIAAPHCSGAHPADRAHHVPGSVAAAGAEGRRPLLDPPPTHRLLSPVASPPPRRAGRYRAPAGTRAQSREDDPTRRSPEGAVCGRAGHENRSYEAWEPRLGGMGT